MDTLESYHEAIARVFGEWEAVPRIPSDFRIDGVMDRTQDCCYVLLDVDFKGGKYFSRTWRSATAISGF